MIQINARTAASVLTSICFSIFLFVSRQEHWSPKLNRTSLPGTVTMTEWVVEPPTSPIKITTTVPLLPLPARVLVTSTHTPPSASLHLTPRWRTGPARTLTSTHRACFAGASPLLICSRGTVAPLRNQCWSPATGLSRRKHARCSSWSRPTWATGQPGWTNTMQPFRWSRNVGGCKAWGTNYTCSWCDRPPETWVWGAWRRAGSWWPSA